MTTSNGHSKVVLFSSLCNQLEDKRHLGHTISFSETADPKAISRVTGGERAESGLGTSILIVHKDLNYNPANNCQFLKHDRLCLRIAFESLLWSHCQRLGCFQLNRP